jgi:hypothetical protein
MSMTDTTTTHTDVARLGPAEPRRHASLLALFVEDRATTERYGLEDLGRTTAPRTPVVLLASDGPRTEDELRWGPIVLDVSKSEAIEELMVSGSPPLVASPLPRD